MSVVYEFKKLAKGSTFCISYTVDHIIYIQATLIQYCIIDSSFLAESCCQVCGCENSRCFQTFAINVLNISNHNPNPYSSYKLLYFNYFPSKLAKTVPVVILLCLTPDDFTYQGRASGWERVNRAYLPISLPWPFPSQTGQNCPFCHFILSNARQFYSSRKLCKIYQSFPTQRLSLDK